MHLPSTLLFASLLSCLFSAQAAPKIPVSAFLHEDEYANPSLSPDGKHIAITARVPIGERFVPVVMIYTLPELKIAGAVRMPVFEVPSSYTWVSNTRLVIAKGRELGPREQPVLTGELLATDLDGSKQDYLFGYNNFKASSKGARYGDDYGWGEVARVPRELNGHFLLEARLWRSNHSMLYDVDSSSASRRLVADLPEPGLHFVVQQNGTPRFAIGTGEDSFQTMYRYDDASGNWEKTAGKKGPRYSPRVFSADDKEFVSLYSPDGGPDKLIKENLATGAQTTLFEDRLASVENMLYGAAHGLPFGATGAVGIPQVRYFDNDSPDAKLHRTLSAQFPGNAMRFFNFTADGNMLLFAVYSDRDPGVFYLYNKLTNKADLLFTAMASIDPDEMSERRPIVFKSRDGLDLDGYLTMPKHAPGSKLPLVLMPHGGPHTVRDSWGFNTDAQFLASRGYAVLQVNFRGSSGRGVKFEHAGYREWGGKVQNDLVDGVRWAVAQGEVDANRVCAYGVSFGGYSALMLAAREPAMFKCAVGYAGIYDLNMLYKEDSTRREKVAFNTIKKYIGEDKAELDRFSPVNLAAQITAPVLLVHGGNDKTAPIAHAEAMRAALVKLGREPEWLYAPNEGHGFYDTRNVIMFYEKLEAFLEKHIGK